MKKFHLFLVCASVTLTAVPAFGADEVVFAEGTSPIKKYSHFFYVNGSPILKDDEGSNAMNKAIANAVENAKKAFDEKCRNTRNGDPSNVRAIPLRDPSNRSQRELCTTEWEDAKRTQGTVVCTARAKGTCTVREQKDPRVTENVSAPARLIEVDGQRFLVDEQGAHPITGATAAQ